MATQADGARSINFGYVGIAPDADGAAGTDVDISKFIANATLPVSNAAGNSTGADAASTQMIPSLRPTFGPFTFEVFKSNIASGLDALLEPLAMSGDVFWIVAAESADDTPSATNPVYTFQCHSLDGWELLSIDTARTDAASVSLTASLTGPVAKAVT